jgi:hypothetical protein
MPLGDFYGAESRFRRIWLSNPERAQSLLDLAQQVVDERWEHYSGIAGA